MYRNIILCLTLAIGLFTASTSEAQFSTKLTSTTQIQVSSPKLIIPEIGSEYRIMVAEPVPETLWVLEYRYIETKFQEGSDWRVYSRSENRDDLIDGAIWLVTRLVVEIRFVETHPEPQYEHVDTVNSQAAADREVEMWRDAGFWAYYTVRRLPVIRP